MKTINLIQTIAFVGSLLGSISVFAQGPDPCFGPDPTVQPILYFSNASCPDYSADFDEALVGVTNFQPISEGFSGSWVVDPASTATAAFNPNLSAGSTASLNVSSAGTLVLTNTYDNLNINAFPWGSCTQTYTTACYQSNIVANPSLSTRCPNRVLLLLDESGSIESSGATGVVEGAVMNLVSTLAGGDTELAIVEFETSARLVSIGGSSAFQTIDATYVNNLNTYLSSPSNLPTLVNGNENPQDQSSYTPGENVNALIGGTNWEDAFQEAIALGGADIVIVLTDGTPTFYNDPIFGVTGEGNVLDMTALVKARDAANSLKTAGSHIFFIGIGDVLTQPFIENSGPDSYVVGSTTADFSAADYLILSQGCADVSVCMSEIANHIIDRQICSDAIPTMGEWGLICLSLIFMIIGVVSIKQPSYSLSKA